MLGQRRRRWPNIKSTLGQCLMFSGTLVSTFLHIKQQLFLDWSDDTINIKVIGPIFIECGLVSASGCVYIRQA